MAVLFDYPSNANNRWPSSFASLLIHCGAIALLIFIGTRPAVQNFITKEPVHLVYAPPKAKSLHLSGGAGGANMLLPPSKGKLPRIAPRQFTPPTAVPQNPAPKLTIDPTLVLDSNVVVPKTDLPNYGDPLAKLGPPSSGPGSNGGIGRGPGGGIGDSRGLGYGPGLGGPGVFGIGNGVSAPKLIYQVEPEYSEDARKAKHQGTVRIQIVVDETGHPRDFQILNPLRMGLDEKAIEAVSKWRFKPGYRAGRPVSVRATVEVNFRLL